MSAKSSCHPELIERYLSMAASVEEARALETHLNECCQCQRAVQDAAAEQEFWHTTAAMLNVPADETQYEIPADMEPRDASWGESLLRRILEPAEQPERIGRLGPYEVVRVVGCGGMGLVVQAWDPGLKRDVAIKIVHPHLLAYSTVRVRFSREARLAASLRHSNIIEIYAVSECYGLPYLVMPFLSQSLLDYAKIHQFTSEEVLQVALQLAKGLQVAHGSGLVHRDIKPSNVMLKDGLLEVVISDFGLAREDNDEGLTQSGMIAGTPHFMSPEQAQGCTVDTSSDLFSLGSLLYWMCTGQAPFAASDPYTALRQVIEARHRAVCDVTDRHPQWLSRLVDLLLVKEISERKLAAAGLVPLLSECLEHLRTPETVELPELLQSEVSHTASSLRPVLAFVGFCALAVVAAGWLYFARPTSSPEPRSQGIQNTRVDEANTPGQEEFAAYYQREGPLDELDWTNLKADLKVGDHEAYWLQRLSQLPIEEIRVEHFPRLELYLESKDPDLKRFAESIFAKNPFREVVEPQEVEIENPFQIVEPE